MELKWAARVYVAELGTDSRYYIDCYNPDGWSAQYRASGGEWTDIDPRDADGTSGYWPSAAMAQLAAQQHYERMRVNGETPDVAASRIPTDPAWYEAKMGETT